VDQNGCKTFDAGSWSHDDRIVPEGPLSVKSRLIEAVISFCIGRGRPGRNATDPFLLWQEHTFDRLT